MSDQVVFPFIENLLTKHLPEAPLFFRDSQMDIDQKRGLTLFGPVDSHIDEIQTIRLGVISDSQGVEDVTSVLTAFNESIMVGDPSRPFSTMAFPGFKSAFKARLIFKRTFNDTLTNNEISNIIPLFNPNTRIRRVAELYAKKIQNICDRMEIPDLVVCHKPKIIEENFGKVTRIGKQDVSKSDKKRIDKLRKNVETHRILAPLPKETEVLLQSVIKSDFRKILKSATMTSNLPIQILNQSTLESLNSSLKVTGIPTTKHRKQHPSTIAWNIATAIYYKANHFPWRVGNLKNNSCFIGIAFFYDKTTHEKNMFASLAQVFSDTGEGMIVRGDTFNWDTKTKGRPQLTKASAQELIHSALELYKRHNDDQPPNKIIIHKTSKFTPNELNGFRYISQEVPRYDFLTISGYHDYRFFRNGDNPVLRGTFIQLPGKRHLLFSSGYTPYLKGFNRPRIPKPLEFSDHHGDSTAEELAKEVISLSRLDWNTTRFSSTLPMTLKFARRVGDILSIFPKKEAIQHQYRFYM